MLTRIQQEKLSWPRFTGSEMAGLTAFLNGPQLGRRRPARDQPLGFLSLSRFRNTIQATRERSVMTKSATFTAGVAQSPTLW